MNTLPRPLDATDRRLIDALHRGARLSMADVARLAGVARGTAYSRLEQMEAHGVITGYGPDIDPERAGYGVTAFCTLDIVQGSHDLTTSALAAIQEVVEVHTVTGVGDLLCRIITRSNDHLHDVLQRIAALPDVTRSQTQLALQTSHRRSVAEVVSCEID